MRAPDIPRLLERARERGAAGDLAPAEAALREVLAAQPDNASALHLLGLARWQAGRAGEAYPLLQQAAAHAPQQAEIHYALAKVTEAVHGAARAIDGYARTSELAPRFAPAWADLGIARAECGDFQAAVEALQRACALGANDAPVLFALGQSLREAGRVDDSIAALREASIAAPDDAAVLHALAQSLRLADRADEACACLRRGIAHAPASAELHHALGNALQDMDLLPEAQTSYRRALALEPEALTTHEALNRMLWASGDHEAYLSSYEQALQRAPHARALHLEHATWLARAGRHEQAESRLREALRVCGAHAETHRLLARSLVNRGDTQQALQHFHRAVELAPRDAQARRDLARVLLMLGDAPAALAQVKAALAQEPQDQEAIAYLGLCWRLAGDAREAWLNDYRRFVRSYRIALPPGYCDMAAFNAALNAALDALHRGQMHPADQTLRGGTQTHGALFERRLAAVQAVRESIEGCVRDYIGAMEHDPEHPLLARKSERFRFAASWSCRLRRQGFHTNHLHPRGWISSCYYVALPEVVRTGDGRQGWITFGQSNLHLHGHDEVAHAVQPEEGLLVLFPSYMFHGTVPFESDQPRTTIAFDVVPD